MKRTSSKTVVRRPLVVVREVIARLTPTQLREVAGGSDDSSTNLTTRTQTEVAGG
jgi:hypothetical protein